MQHNLHTSWAVEARLFSGRGRMIVRVRPATLDDEQGVRATRECEIWTDLFPTEDEARAFAGQYEET